MFSRICRSFFDPCRPKFNRINEFFARRYIPEDHQTELANALFDWKYKK